MCDQSKPLFTMKKQIEAHEQLLLLYPLAHVALFTRIEIDAGDRFLIGSIRVDEAELLAVADIPATLFAPAPPPFQPSEGMAGYMPAIEPAPAPLAFSPILNIMGRRCFELVVENITNHPRDFVCRVFGSYIKP